MSLKVERIPPTQKVEHLARYVLAHWPISRETGRGGDKHLIFRSLDLILSKHGCRFTPRQFRVLVSAPSPESFRRVRQKIHQDAEKGGPEHADWGLLPSDKRRNAKQESEKWRNWARKGELVKQY